jgi:hypothetical protein
MKASARDRVALELLRAREIEAPEVHGDIPALLGHLNRLGFHVVDVITREDVPKSQAGLLLLDCVRERAK